jgi:molecular chaperone DnaK (HSP70)
MKDWPTLQHLLSESLVDFLGKSLPSVGGSDWWARYVIDCLTPAQARSAQGVAEGDLHAFDLAALLRIADRNWAEVALKLRLRRETRNLVFEMKDVRNRYAHASLRGVELDDQLRDVDTAMRLMQSVGASNEAIGQVKAIHRRLLVQVAAGADNHPDEGDITATTTGSLGQTATPDVIDTQDTPTKPSGDTKGKPKAQKKIDPPDEGVVVVDSGATSKTGGWMVNPSSPGREVEEALGARTYVGIDFGTSTTVVSVVRLESRDRLVSRTLPIQQPEEFGGSIVHHLVNTVLAWQNNQLLFGRDAYRMRQELFEGRTVFSSFKMRLGVDVGPTYPETALRKGAHTITIEDANDAAREFFKVLYAGIKDAVTREGLPNDLRFAVSVPASFEANQRRDLLRNMKDAGLPAEEICLIDEPNAAFLSFLHESSRGETNQEILQRLRGRGANILVYDFGAGTCDVSIIDVRISDRGISSRNRSISRFTALGGDDLDRAIAKHALLPVLLDSAHGFEPEQRDIEERLIPRLQPTAERLKLAAIEWLADRGVNDLQGMRQNGAEVFYDHGIPGFKIRGQSLTLLRPALSLAQLADALEPFIGRFDPERNGLHVFAPVVNAMDKSGLTSEELDAVLFIGGSAASPIVRNAVMRHLPDEVRAIVPTDLRSHVSLGAALHSLGFHAFHLDLIRPITSEAIHVVTRGGHLETVIPAAAEVPTSKPFITRLRIDRAGQSAVELPICVGTESKLLGLLRIQASNTKGFSVDEEVKVEATINHDKLLEIRASVAGKVVKTGLMNPLANRELSPAETRMLEAKQKFNESLLSSRGKPSKVAVLAYAQAAMEAEAFDLAAEMFIATERIDPTENHATNICYCFSKAGRAERSTDWARKAYERKPDAVAAYNLSCSAKGIEQEKLLRDAVRLRPEFSYALLALGRAIRDQDPKQGRKHVEQAVQLLKTDLQTHRIDRDHCRMLIVAAKEVGDDDLADRAQARLDSMLDTSVYDEDNLAVPILGQRQLGRS